MKEVGRTDAIESRDRCLQARSQAVTIEDGQALWRAARKFNKRVRTSDPDRIRLESQNPVGVSRVELGS